MCDYSLMHYPNRLAVQDEELVAYRFPSGSIGLASPADLRPKPAPPGAAPEAFWARVKRWFEPVEACSIPAVCIPPGARLMLRDIGTSFQREHGLHKDEEGTFEQISANANAYRDAIRFRNGRVVRLQELPAGQPVLVLSLAAEEKELQPVAIETSERAA